MYILDSLAVEWHLIELDCMWFIKNSNSNSKSGINLLALFDWVCLQLLYFFSMWRQNSLA